MHLLENGTARGAILALLACLLAVPAAASTPAQPPAKPVVTALPAGAVTLQSCSWKGKTGKFDADIRITNHTNQKIAKSRLLLTFVDTSGEALQGYFDMQGKDVMPAPGVPMTGKWVHGVFPTSMRTMGCTLVGVKFQGYPNVIYSTIK